MHIYIERERERERERDKGGHISLCAHLTLRCLEKVPEQDKR